MARFFLFLLTLFVTSLYSQENDWRLYQTETTKISNDSDTILAKPATSIPGKITVVTNNKLDTLLAVLHNNPPELKGFRVLIYIGTSRDDADEVRSIYLKNEYPWPHYLTFKDPNFVVEIGDFMTRLQAEKVKEQLTKDYSNPYIVLTAIKFPEYKSSVEKP